MFLSVRARGAGRWDWMGGGGLMVGGAAALYCDHKSLHDRHLLQSILTGVFSEKLPKAREQEKTRATSSSSLRCNIPL